MAKWRVVMMLLFASLALGQSMTKTSSHSGSISMVDHHPACGGAGTLNCWHQETSTFSGVWYTNRGMLTTDANGCIYTGTFPTGLITWTKQTPIPCGMTNPQYDASGNLYALSMGSGNLYLKEDNNGTWAGVNGSTAVQFSVATDGEEFFGKVNAAGAMNVTADPTHAWTAVSGGPYKYIDVISPNIWLAVKGAGTVWLYSHGTWSQIGTNSNAVQVNGGFHTDLSGNPMIYYLGSDGYVYHMNSGAPTGWDKLNGSGNTALAAGGSLNVMSLGGTGGTHLYRFGDSSPKITINYSGTVTCAVPPPYNQQICPTFTHTASLKACWGTKGCHTVNATPWNNSGSWSLTATSDEQDDPIGCLDNPLMDGCAPNENGNMNCSGGGSDTQTSDFSIGESIDVRNWLYDDVGYPQGPILEGTPTVGVYAGYDNFTHTDACILGIPTCPSPNPLEYSSDCAFTNPQIGQYCYDLVYADLYVRHTPQTGSPWVITQPWIKENSTGITVCIAGEVPFFPTYSVAPIPSCQ